MKRLGIAVLALAGLVCAGPYDTWSNYRDVTVNTTAGGANVATAQNNFPLLVRLTNASAATGANVLTGALTAGGLDVRFTDSTGQNAISFEIETWSSASAAFWVKVPVVAGNATTKIRMYWGKAGQGSTSSGSAVFDTTNGFVSVWHMNGTTTETSATAYGYVATPFGTPGANAAGAAGPARTFDGTSQYFQAVGTATSAASFSYDSTYTLSAWVKADSIVTAGSNTGHAIVTKGDHQWALAIFGATAPNRYYEITTKAGSNGWRQTTTAPTTTPIAYSGDTANSKISVWRYVTGTWNGLPLATATGQIYTDGVLQKTTTFDISNSPTTSRNTNRDIHIGVLSNEANNSTNATGTFARYFKGTIDEVNISRGVRDSNWIRLSYQTQKPGASAVTLGAAQTPPAPVAVTAIYYMIPGSGNAPRDTMNFQVGTPVNLALNVTGGPADSFKVTTGTLPAGLTVNLFTGTLTGTPTAIAAATNLTLTAYSSLGNLTRGLRTTVLAGPLVLSKYSSDTATYTVGMPVANSPQLAPNTRPATKFTITPALPAGIVLDSVSGVISGTPSAVSAAANYTVKAKNATDSSSRNLRFTVVANGEVYTTWANHRTIYMNTSNTSNGAKITADVRNFPIAVRIPATDSIFRQVLAGAADLRFTKADNATFLPYQIEQWDSAKAATIWVLVDTVKANSLTQNIRMHWGKAGSANLSNGSSVFSVANGFQAVWHMGSKTGDELDATANGFVAAAQAAPGDSTGGAVGRARKFDGATQYFQVTNSATGALDFGLDKNYTISAWANPNQIPVNGDGMKIVEKGDDQWTVAVYNGSNPKYWEITTRVNGSGTYMQCTSEAAAVTAESGINKWNHIVGIYRGGAINTAVAESLWVNGVFLATRTETPTSLTTNRNTTRPVNIGAQGTGVLPAGAYTRFWTGMLDEIRISNVVRSPNWVTLEYENQKPGSQMFVSFTPPTSINSNASAQIASGLGLNVKSSTNGVVFSLQGAGTGDKAVLNLVDMWGRTVFSGSFENGSQLSWNGVANNGQSVSAGIYVARVTVVNTQNNTRKVLEHKVPFTR